MKIKLDTIQVEVTCLFCDSPIRTSDTEEYKSGDVVKCEECGEGNDFDSLLDVAKERLFQKGANAVNQQIESAMKNLFKK